MFANQVIQIGVHAFNGEAREHEYEEWFGPDGERLEDKAARDTPGAERRVDTFVSWPLLVLTPRGPGKASRVERCHVLVRMFGSCRDRFLRAHVGPGDGVLVMGRLCIKNRRDKRSGVWTSSVWIVARGFSLLYRRADRSAAQATPQASLETEEFAALVRQAQAQAGDSFLNDDDGADWDGR